MGYSKQQTLLSLLFWPIVLMVSILLFGILRLLYLLPAIKPRPIKKRSRKQDSAYILIVLGSGGHTTEMFMLLKDLDSKVYPTRRYVISEGDNHSITKMQDFEENLETLAKSKNMYYGSYDYKIVPRARRIHQSLLTTPRTAMNTFVVCLRTFARADVLDSSRLVYPDLILANGPANAFMLICAAFLLRFLHVPGTQDSLRCIYVESWARLSRLSLTGRLLRLTGLCDRFLVQWPKLEVQNSRKRQLGEYHGPLVI